MKLSAYIRLRVGVNDQEVGGEKIGLISVATVFRCYFFPCNTFITDRKKRKEKKGCPPLKIKILSSHRLKSNFFLQQVFIRIDISILTFHTLKHAHIDIERYS